MSHAVSVPSATAARSVAVPSSSYADLARLAGLLLASFVRRPRPGVSAVTGAWLRDLHARRGSDVVILRIGPKRVLLVGSAEVSRAVLEPAPSADTFVAGRLKVDGMAYLAARALTLAHGADWVRLRQFNEQVLATGTRHPHEQAFVAAVSAAFAQLPEDGAAIRRCMGTAMLRIVLGDDVPARLAGDVQRLFARVQSPLRRRLAGRRGVRERDEFFAALRSIWRRRAAAAGPTLIGAACAHAGALEEEEALHQLPHWMFTFTGSGSDLLMRTLAVIGARPAVRARVLAEIAAAGTPGDAGGADRMPYLEACLRETGRLFPPVTKTFHQAGPGAVLHGYEIDPRVAIIHYLPLLHRHDGSDAAAHTFRPERWLAGDAASSRPAGDMFLRGARACPGQDLILLVCRTAAAHLLRSGLRSRAPSLAQDPMPVSFPLKEARFTYVHDHG